jgi:hypothetical protein
MRTKMSGVVLYEGHLYGIDEAEARPIGTRVVLTLKPHFATLVRPNATEAMIDTGHHDQAHILRRARIMLENLFVVFDGPQRRKRHVPPTGIH